MKKFAAVIGLALTVLTLVTVTFSWIIDTSGTEARHIVVDYGDDSGHTMTIAPNNIKVAIGTKDEVGNFIECDEESFLDLRGLYPTSSLTYYMRFTNIADIESSLQIYFQNISIKEVKDEEGNDTSLLDVIYVNCLRSDVDSEEVSGSLVYLAFKDLTRLKKTGDTYSFLLMSGVKVPPTGTRGFIEYECNFTMSAEASNIYQGLDIDIGMLKIVC